MPKDFQELKQLYRKVRNNVDKNLLLDTIKEKIRVNKVDLN